MAVTPDLNQIAVVMSQLQHNYSQLAQNWFNIFYNPTPMDISLTFYDELGNEIEYNNIPNRAKDMRNILNGDGDPNGSVAGNKGFLYQDLTNALLYIKTTNDSSNGWVTVADMQYVNQLITKGNNTPEGSVSATTGTLYVKETTGEMFIKTTPSGNTGWKQFNTADDIATVALINEKIEEVVGRLSDLQTINKSNIVSAINELVNKSYLPDQDGMAGYYLTTNGEQASWTSRGTYEPPLLSFKWFDHQVNEQCWLRADLFSWHDSALYPLAYNHLVNDITNISVSTETISDITVTYYQAVDGHKIVMPDQATNIYSIYAITGHANYYILDLTNERFKLPCEQHGEIVDKYENGDAWYRVYSDGWCEQGGIVYNTTDIVPITFLKPFTDTSYNIDALPSKYSDEGYSESILYLDKTSTSVEIQPRWNGIATAMEFNWRACGYLDGSAYPFRNTLSQYLYFYVGQFERTIIEQEQDIEDIKTALNEKVDKEDMVSVIPVIEDSWDPSTNTGYRVWSNNYCEQWGLITTTSSTSNQVISFPKAFKDTNYIFLTTPITDGSSNIDTRYMLELSSGRTSSGTKVVYTSSRSWKACGYLPSA